MLAPASASMTRAAPRVSQIIGIIFSRPRPPMMAPPAATHSASVEPMPTASGSPYLAARLTVRIWVRSPNSATKTTAKAMPATGKNCFPRPVIGDFGVVAALAVLAPQQHGPDQEQARGDGLDRAVRQQPGHRPAVTASATCTAKAAAAPANTKIGRYRVPMTRHANTVLSGNSEGKMIRKAVSAAAEFNLRTHRVGPDRRSGEPSARQLSLRPKDSSSDHGVPQITASLRSQWSPGGPDPDVRAEISAPGDGATPLRCA